MILRILCCVLSLIPVCLSQINGAEAYQRFLEWKKDPQVAALRWEDAIQRYKGILKSQGASSDEIEKTINVINARDEAVLYDQIYSKPARFQISPNRLLMEAVKGRTPGKALDVGMGQGRNAIFLAKQGWKVTGFDVSETGLTEAKRLAAVAGVQIDMVHTSDEEFDFGTSQWDLIAILYPIEKRSVHRVAAALKMGGIVVVECAHKEAGNSPFEYDSNELLQIFQGFRILKYEDLPGIHDWNRKELRMVRLVAQKQ